MKIMQIEWRYKFVKIVTLLVLGLLAATVLLQSRLVTAEINSPDSPAVWGQEERVSTTSATGAFVPVIDRAPDGTVMVVYRHLTGGGYILPYYVKSTNNGIELEFTTDGIEALADTAHQVNQSTQNIGARRLHTILERLLEEVSFEAPDPQLQKVTVGAAYVEAKLAPIMRDEDLSRFIL